MKQFKVGDYVYGIVWFPELVDYDPINFDFIYGKILNIKLYSDDDRVTVYEIEDNQNHKEFIYSSEELPFIFETKEEMYKLIFKHEREFLMSKVEILNKYESEFNENKEKFFETYE